MMPLSQFVEPIGSAGGFNAFRMDSTVSGSDMRRAAGLGTCECCDYVTVSQDKESIVFIEETDLDSTIVEFKQKFNYLNDQDQVDMLYDEVLKEHRLKLYGSMLILCRLSSSREDVKALFPVDKFQFWLVTTRVQADSALLMDYLNERLKGFLKSSLLKETMSVVQIIPSKRLFEKLSTHAQQIT